MLDRRVDLLEQWMNGDSIGVADLAEKIGYHPTYIDGVLKRRFQVSDKLVGAIAREYGLEAAAAAFGLEYKGAAAAK